MLRFKVFKFNAPIFPLSLLIKAAQLQSAFGNSTLDFPELCQITEIFQSNSVDFKVSDALNSSLTS